jgi:ubiquinone/menaquinone biosynthesis C-methylase UbiE
MAKTYLQSSTNVNAAAVTYFNDAMTDILVSGDGEGGLQSVIRPGSKLLDVCAGPGTFTISLIKKIGIEMALLMPMLVSDFAPGMIEAARQIIPAMLPTHVNLDFTVIDVQNIEIPSNEMDIVSCIFGYFVPNRRLAFSEVCRVTKVTGKAVFGTWKHTGMMVVMNDFRKYIRLPEMSTSLAAAHCCADGEALQAELIELGFRSVAVYELEKIFSLQLTNEVVDGLFGQPAGKNDFASVEPKRLREAWFEFLLQPNCPHKVERDGELLVLQVRYIANVAIATK